MSAYLVHLGYVLMLCALVARDVLWLRATLILAQLALWSQLQSVLGLDLVERSREAIGPSDRLLTATDTSSVAPRS